MQHRNNHIINRRIVMRSIICFCQNHVTFFASLCTVPLLTVSCLHAFLYSGFAASAAEKSSESLQTQVFWAWHVWAAAIFTLHPYFHVLIKFYMEVLLLLL